MITHAYALPGADSMIDVIRDDGLTACFHETEAEVKTRYPGAEVIAIQDWVDAKAARQAEVPREWKPVTQERYWEMLEVLPPAAMKNGAFLVGEPYDHCCATGRPQFSCFRETKDGLFWELTAHITHKEFCSMFGQCSYDYRE